MSWSTFKAELGALTGDPHVTPQKFADTVAGAYHNCILRHLDMASGGGKLTILPGNDMILSSQILQLTQANMGMYSYVNIVQQIGPAILTYWAGALATGPAGNVIINFTGTWIAPPLPNNLDFRIFAEVMTIAAQTHLLTLVGIYTMFAPPGATTPWSGTFLKTFG